MVERRAMAFIFRPDEPGVVAMARGDDLGKHGFLLCLMKAHAASPKLVVGLSA